MSERLPPFVPEDIVIDIKKHVEQFHQDYDIDIQDLETKMVHFGKQVWPYFRAFDDMYKGYETELAEKLLHQRVTPSISKKLHVFSDLGGTYADVHAGRAHDMFDVDERQSLIGLLVDLKHDIRKHAIQKIRSQDEKKYHEKVEQYGKMVQEVNGLIEDIRQFAHDEAHEMIAEDIHDKIRTIEHSFAFIGPPVSMEEVRNLKNHYISRQQDLKVRGLIVI